ncbi:hypothetical protein Bpfe_030135 [Biomphalaria pfeifferi]|uniref:Uncharacterized protein n=1 Tax=Biomphalaria pfeifferi TaxID=112525 RepID=A0AAD8AQC8_BIOPF|nr:hypothetical protein Bpfe_030135 [Biomphalaria pfeifferi]
MPSTSKKMHTSCKRASPSTRACRKAWISSDRRSVFCPSLSPAKKPQIKNRRKRSSINPTSAQENQKDLRRKTKNKEVPLEKRLKRIISQLGLIPGDRAMDFALAYDSITPLLKARLSLGMKPPVSPPNFEKFNLLYVPDEYTPTMRKMRLINKYTEDILLGMRKNTGSRCNTEEKYEMLRIDAAEIENVIRMDEDEPKQGRKNKQDIRPSGKRRAANSRNTVKLNLSTNKRLTEDLCTAEAASSRRTTSSLRRLRSSPRARASRPVTDRHAGVASFSSCSRRPTKRHQSTNTSPPAPVVMKTTILRECERNNLPIFYKHIKVHKWL